ncbi:hypothetical protein K1T71_005873 [Dendrolimus kikuchii]|uniref:Uncharacterized protein n=1 Tax=Dendrolimus kikuchii TaxID=765133 RepID=A0ACC1D2E5_9NEOP|nr:hypothetical protein K1T71_005873 [Dendrolimus kikuchii]
MARFRLKDSDEYYLHLSDQPKRFDADSPVTNVFFDDTNGQVFTVRSGGIAGVTVTSMDETKCTSFQMEDRGPIISIKLSLDQKILAIQRSQDNPNATVEFINFKDLAPTNVEYSHTCKWKNARILGFVWPRVNEIAFITDHGIELLQVLPEKKQLKNLKSSSFSGAWFSWCAQSSIVLLAGNNGALLQPFSLSNSTITKLQKLELDSSRPVVERDVFILRLCEATWCAVFRHGNCAATAAPGPTERYKWGAGLGLVGSLATVSRDNFVLEASSSQTSQVFDILEESKVENNTVIHIPIVAGNIMKPAVIGEQMCPMYSGTWVVFQPDYIIDARLGCLWRVHLSLTGLAHSVPKEEIPKLVAALLRRTNGKETIYRILNQLVSNAGSYLVELSKAFDEINSIYRRWADMEVARNTAGQAEGARSPHCFRVVLSQPEMCGHVLQAHADHGHIVQVVTAYIASLSRHDMVVQHPVGELCVRTLVTHNASGRLRALVRRGGLGDSRPLACQLLSLGHLDKAAAQLALDMMWRLKAYEEILEVLLSWDEPVGAAGAARQAGAGTWTALPPRKLLAAAQQHARRHSRPAAFVAVYHALVARNERTRGSPHFLKGEQCDSYIEYYKQLTMEQ